MITTATHWRRALVLDLGLFNIAVFALCLLPPDTLTLSEWAAMAGSALCLIGLISHASRRVHLPGEQWAYLATSWLGCLVLVAFLADAQTTVTYEVAVPLFLLSGVASAGAAHIIDGGVARRPRGDG